LLELRHIFNSKSHSHETTSYLKLFKSQQIMILTLAISDTTKPNDLVYKKWRGLFDKFTSRKDFIKYPFTNVLTAYKESNDREWLQLIIWLKIIQNVQKGGNTWLNLIKMFWLILTIIESFNIWKNCILNIEYKVHCISSVTTTLLLKNTILSRRYT
jgi:hypothetical protein